MILPYTSGFSGTGKRQMNDWIVQNGYPALADALLRGQMAKLDKLSLPRRWFCHNPGGLSDDGKMQVSQIVDCKLVYPKIIEGLYKALRKLKSNGVDCCCYVGWNNSAETLSRIDRAMYFMDSVKELASTGCTLAFDVAGTYPADHHDSVAIRQLQMTGIRCMVEGGPVAPHWNETKTGIIVQNNYRVDLWPSWLGSYAGEKLAIVLPAEGWNPTLAQAKVLTRLGFTVTWPEYLWGDTFIAEWEAA